MVDRFATTTEDQDKATVTKIEALLDLLIGELRVAQDKDSIGSDIPRHLLLRAEQAKTDMQHWADHRKLYRPADFSEGEMTVYDFAKLLGYQGTGAIEKWIKAAGLQPAYTRSEGKSHNLRYFYARDLWALAEANKKADRLKRG